VRGLRGDGKVEPEEAMTEQEIAKAREHERRFFEQVLSAAVNAECTCGGSGPNDSGCCVACKVWHRVMWWSKELKP